MMTGRSSVMLNVIATFGFFYVQTYLVATVFIIIHFSHNLYLNTHKEEAKKSFFHDTII